MHDPVVKITAAVHNELLKHRNRLKKENTYYPIIGVLCKKDDLGIIDSIIYPSTIDVCRRFSHITTEDMSRTLIELNKRFRSFGGFVSIAVQNYDRAGEWDNFLHGNGLAILSHSIQKPIICLQYYYNSIGGVCIKESYMNVRPISLEIV